jgi:hypothetical protein
MIALYRTACERAPDDLALAAALGRVYFEQEMLDEAAEQFEKLEVKAPDLPVVHAFLGAVFEKRGQTRDAFDEYRRALRLGRGFDWPHRCEACATVVPTWQDRCPQCQRWNTLRSSPSPLTPPMRAWALAALDLVFPALCPVCQATLGAGRRDPLCGSCWDAVHRLGPPACVRCGLPFMAPGAGAGAGALRRLHAGAAGLGLGLRGGGVRGRRPRCPPRVSSSTASAPWRGRSPSSSSSSGGRRWPWPGSRR